MINGGTWSSWSKSISVDAFSSAWIEGDHELETRGTFYTFSCLYLPSQAIAVLNSKLSCLPLLCSDPPTLQQNESKQWSSIAFCIPYISNYLHFNYLLLRRMTWFFGYNKVLRESRLMDQKRWVFCLRKKEWSWSAVTWETYLHSFLVLNHNAEGLKRVGDWNRLKFDNPVIIQKLMKLRNILFLILLHTSRYLLITWLLL
jgi:hypothetical protein